ncbi:ORF6N domain-containing protein [Synechococcus sp. H60.2]|uniref:hypothetical protein n=1 Tax=Synechococcus sp. H60.2 TaxID=2964518 RepID=UPI0039C028F0
MSGETQSRLQLDLWLRCLEKDYLGSFIPAGGATVKLAVVPKDSYSHLYKSLQEKLSLSSFRLFDLSEERINLHSIENFWFALAQRVDWESFARELRYSILRKIGYSPSSELQDCTLEELAELYQVEAREINIQFQREIKKLIFQDYSLALDFRKAISRLIYEPLQSPGTLEGLCLAVQEWLKGTLKSISQVRGAAIFRRIDRTSSREILLSFLRLFTRQLGWTAILVSLFHYYERRENGRPIFTRRQIIELYETLREFIDAESKLEKTVLIFMAPLDFIESELLSYHKYRALQTRIENEVYSPNYPNPCTTMVQLQ